MMHRLVVVSADGHVGAESLAVFKPYLEKRYWGDLDAMAQDKKQAELAAMRARISEFSPEALDVIDDRGAIRSGWQNAVWDPDRRLQALDDEGVAGELLLAGVQNGTLPRFQSDDAELGRAGVAAYHRWLVDYMAGSGGRLVGVADPGPCLDMAAAVRELSWVAQHGFVSVGVPGLRFDKRLPPLYDSYYEAFWAACAELGLVLSVHTGWGQDSAKINRFLEKLNEFGELDMNNAMEVADRVMGSSASPFALDVAPRRVFWQLLVAGVFDRYPDLRLAWTEVRADWIPATLACLDERFAREEVPLTMAPSEYYARHCAVTPSSHRRHEVEMRHDIGLTKMMFGMDYPHPESTWPNTRDWMRATFDGVPEDDVRLIMGENAIAFYGLDRDKLANVAERIGPTPEEVLGEGHSVDPRKIEHFHKRSGFSKPAEVVDTDVIVSSVDEDLVGLAHLGAR